MMITVLECPVCSGKTFKPFLNCRDYAVSHETFSLNKCQECELLITSPRPAPEKIDQYYISPNYTSHISRAKTLLDKIYLTARDFNLKWKISQLAKYTHTSTTNSLLDFGCGTGELLRVAKQHGWTTIGVEPSHQARHHAHPSILNDIKASISDLSLDHSHFNAITLWHVLEHVDNLDATIQNLKNLLANNGTIFIAVPNTGCWDAVHYHQYWAAYDVPRHLWHFNQKSMTTLLTKHHLSISKIIPMRLDAFYISLLSEKYRQSGFTPRGVTSALINGLRSNYNAKGNLEYSSLLYVVKK